jgi:CheY-like chemotaxis protein
MSGACDLPLRVLVVEDLADTADTLAALVAIWGHEAHVARDGTAALAEAASFLPQVVLLDFQMPGLCGGEVAVRLQRMPELAGAVLVATTANSPDDPRVAVFAGLFDHFLRKPYDPVVIERLLRSCARRTADNILEVRCIGRLEAMLRDAARQIEAAARAYRNTEHHVRQSLELLSESPTWSRPREHGNVPRPVRVSDTRARRTTVAADRSCPMTST